jgi:hypothetical protein
MYLDAIEDGARRTAGPAAAEQYDLVSQLREPAKDFVQMDLGPASERILTTLPVHHGNAHARHGAAIAACGHSLPSLRA